MGVTESALNHADRARELLEPAVKAGVRRPSAYVELARLRLADVHRQTFGDGKLGAAQLSAVLTPLFEARKQPPALPETYELIAAAWAQSAVAPTPDNLAVLDEGIRAFPRDSTLLYNAAQLYRQAGAAPTATSIARLGLRFTTDPAAKTKFEQCSLSLPPRRRASNRPGDGGRGGRRAGLAVELGGVVEQRAVAGEGADALVEHGEVVGRRRHGALGPGGGDQLVGLGQRGRLLAGLETAA